MYELRPATSNDYEFLYDLLVATMKEYVERIWGWEDAYQQTRFRTNFRAEDYQVIVVSGQDIGAISVEDRETELFLSEIQISPDHQRQGWGTAIIQDLIGEAARRQIPLALRVLRSIQHAGFTGG